MKKRIGKPYICYLKDGLISLQKLHASNCEFPIKNVSLNHIFKFIHKYLTKNECGFGFSALTI